MIHYHVTVQQRKRLILSEIVLLRNYPREVGNDTLLVRVVVGIATYMDIKP